MPRHLSFAASLLVLLSPLTLAQSAQRTPVLVELFTSEGCSSCPPADRLLAALDVRQPVDGAQVIVLEEHVDYWDAQGWRDRFSSSAFTQRQNNYAPRLHFDDPYTPQMVVDGSIQFVGNNSSKAIEAITTAAIQPKIPLSLNSVATDGRHITGSVQAPGVSQLPHGDLIAVLIEPAASTDVKSGENGGHRLTHVNVVRVMERIGKLENLSRGPVSFKLTAPIGSIASQMSLVVFAQLPNQGAVRGATTTAIHP